MKVSIIIPVYKVEEHIETCISSVIHQTHADLEIILVDDCGGDASMDKALRLLKASERDWKVVRHEKNRGLSAARNSGVEIASGDSITFLDSDDYLCHDAIEQLATLQERHRADVVVGGADLISLKGEKMGNKLHIRQDHLSENPFESLLNRDLYTSAWAKLINRQFYQANGLHFKEGLIHEDEPWILLLALKSKRVYFSDKVVYNYVQRESSIMVQAKSSLKAVNSYIEIIGLTHEYLSKYYTGEWKRVSKWFHKRLAPCLKKIYTCPEIDRQEKLALYKKLYARFPWLSSCGFTQNSLLRTTFILSTFLPRHLALYLSAALWSRLK